MTKTTFADPADDEPKPMHFNAATWQTSNVASDRIGFTAFVLQSYGPIESEPMSFTDTTPVVTSFTEFAEGGDPRFRKLLSEMMGVHVKKGADYGSDGDFLANCRGSEALGIDAWKGVLIRMGDKMIRLHNAAKGQKLQNESVQDSFMDLANYAIIGLILFNEEVEKEEAAAAEVARRERIERQGVTGQSSSAAHPSVKHTRVSLTSQYCTCGAKLENGLCPHTF